MRTILFSVFFTLSFWSVFGQSKATNEGPNSRFLGALAGSNAEISGVVYAGGQPSDSIWVSVYKESGPNTLAFVKATQTNSSSGTYLIDNLDEGTYYISAQPMTYSLKQSYAPTYYGDSAIWSLSKACYVQGKVGGKDINLTPIVQISGTEDVNGSIKFGKDVAGYNEGDPVVNASLLIYTLDNQLLSITKSNSAGKYEFTNLPNQQLKVLANLQGKKSIAAIVNPAELKNELTFWVTETQSYGKTDPLVISTTLEKTASKIYPNPASEKLKIENNDAFTDLTIYGISGEVLISAPIDGGLLNVDVSYLESGAYMIQLKSEESVVIQKLLIE